jgi:hypothetical protein
MFLAMGSAIASNLHDKASAIDFQTRAVAAAEKDPHAPSDFVEAMRMKLEKLKKS